MSADDTRTCPLPPTLVAAHLADESRCVEQLREDASFAPEIEQVISARAGALVQAVREHHRNSSLEAFLNEYGLDSEEGIRLMALAEGLLRIPWPETAAKLVRDKLAGARWDAHIGRSRSAVVNAATRVLLMSGRLMAQESGIRSLAQRVAQGSEPVIRRILLWTMHRLAGQFVIGRDIEEALQCATRGDARRYRYSFDMLGEAALTHADAVRYQEAYAHAIVATGAASRELSAPLGVSVKLSALHPRSEYSQRKRTLPLLAGALADLAALARAHDVLLTVDAEEAHRLELTLAVFERTLADPRLSDWDGLGLAVQVYQKRAPAVLDWLTALAATHRTRIPIRLVKGAYWDYEIKRAQQLGLAGYPVYTRKAHTDVAYLACARRLLAGHRFHPQFATHNAHTVAAILEMAGGHALEFQRLYGMGEVLYDTVLKDSMQACRVYAPVGSHHELLPYLVRRLLENGANSSFVHRITDVRVPVETLTTSPVQRLRAPDTHRAAIPLPEAIYGTDRRNSRGIALDNCQDETELYGAVRAQLRREWRAAPLIDGELHTGRLRPVTSPHDRRVHVGEVREADVTATRRALDSAAMAYRAWAGTSLAKRARILRRAADLLEKNYPMLIALCVREGGRTVPDALADAREAVDFLRYYAALAENDLAPRTLQGPTGEDNHLAYEGRGVFACISPWNFPIAILTGQIGAALVAGNAVVAK
ncbi:MAG: bifunctional proline dehydrogenase/L-glutamate gamma-semialdehyde dehydrogenase PutA, partial [Hydrogenophaga sp.]